MPGTWRSIIWCRSRRRTAAEPPAGPPTASTRSPTICRARIPLTAVSAESNRDKSDSDPAAWRPPDPAAWCRYARNWIAVKLKWGLAADEAEASALREMLSTCTEDGNAGPDERLDRPVRVFPYATCAEAEAAGLERRRGPRGSGSGFPADQVAYARDGDEDGIVCER